MADLSKLKLNGTTYNFKDTEARLALLNKDIRVFQLYQNENEEWTIGEEEANLMTYVNDSFVVIYYNGKPYFYDTSSDRGARFFSIDGSWTLFMYSATASKYIWDIPDQIDTYITGKSTMAAIYNAAGRLVPYGYCQTAAATVAKTVTVSPEPAELAAGLVIAVKFQYANTSTNPTLNVNDLGAIAIKRYGTTAAGTSAASNWNANSVVTLTYDGTYWQLTDFNNTTYSGMTDAEVTAGSSTSNRLITPARLKLGVTTWAPVKSVNGQTGDVVLNIPTVPTNVSAFANDAGYLTSYTETDPTVPDWAKASTKPTYTASEVGALPDTTVIPDVSGKVDKAGDTMTGQLIVPYNAQYIDGGIKFKNNGSYQDVTLTAIGGWHDSSYDDDYPRVKFIQGTSGSVLVGGIQAPQNSNDAANKHYVDNQTALIKTTAGSNNIEYNLIGTQTSNTNTSAVNVYNPGSISFAKTTTEGRLTLGSSSLPGKIRLYSNVTNATGYTDLVSGATSTNTRTITFPDATGTVALTTDIPSVPSWAMQSSKPSYTFSELTSHPTTINDYGITDAYTKTEVDGMVSGVLHYKGTKATVSALPSSGNTTGDVWHITADGSEYAWDGSAWQELGAATDLSGYVPTSTKVNNKALSGDITLTASDIGALPSNTTYVSSFNGDTGAITYTAPVTSVNGQTGAVTITDSDKNVEQNLSTSNLNLPILLRNNTDSTSGTTDYVRFASSVTVQPSSGNLKATKFNNYVLAAACEKSVDSSIVTGSNSTNLPTSAAVAAYVDAAIPDSDIYWVEIGGTVDWNEVLEANSANKQIMAYKTTEYSSKMIYLLTEFIASYPQVMVFSNIDQFNTQIGSWIYVNSGENEGWSYEEFAVPEHNHGYISNAGELIPLQAKAIAANDSLLFADASANNKLTQATLTFGSSTTQYLANNGTWQNIPQPYNASTNPTGYLTINDLPLYDGSVSNP